MNKDTTLTDYSLARYWSIDHERVWLASVLSLMTLKEEKIRFIRNYLTGLTNRAISFDGVTDMPSEERLVMETFCLRQMFELEQEDDE